MGEDVSGLGEASRRQWWGMIRRLAPLQGLDQDAFDPAHVDEVHVQGPAAGGVQTLRRVALSEADQLVSLPDLGPWKGAFKEPVGRIRPPPVPARPRCA